MVNIVSDRYRFFQVYGGITSQNIGRLERFCDVFGLKKPPGIGKIGVILNNFSSRRNRFCSGLSFLTFYRLKY